MKFMINIIDDVMTSEVVGNAIEIQRCFMAIGDKAFKSFPIPELLIVSFAAGLSCKNDGSIDENKAIDILKEAVKVTERERDYDNAQNRCSAFN